MQLTIEIPETVMSTLVATGTDPARAALEGLALEGYRSRKLFEEDLRRMLGYETGLEVHAFLSNHGVALNYSLDDWMHDREEADRQVAEFNERQVASR